MSKCAYPDCDTEIDQKPGRGRPRKFCDIHSRQRKVTQDKSRDRSKPARIGSQCCEDTRAVNPRRRKCDQHRQWQRFLYDHRKTRGTRRDVTEFTALLQEFCGGDIDERNFSLVSWRKK